jgi:flagellar hook-associated protein 1 FlgK
VPVTVTATQSLSQIADAINAAAFTAGAQTRVTNANGTVTYSGVQASLVGSSPAQLRVTSGTNNLTFSGVTGDILSGLGLSGSPTGNLGAATTTFGGYATDLITDVASRASSAKDDSTSKTTTLSALQTTFSSESGVNIDQQTAQLSTLQNLYAASARVITTVNSMFTSLISAVGA